MEQAAAALVLINCPCYIREAAWEETLQSASEPSNPGKRFVFGPYINSLDVFSKRFQSFHPSVFFTAYTVQGHGRIEIIVAIKG